ncbi:LAMI_0F08394g1_1 [Lachancea mirantina]|uniref:LAMI_0F08394g1_1 n=1 Tax=Lachancea mirantina TaxID=1230905 RepID=A0A1G4K0F7_9SACH|nr:LAMI_0F08394g1_1 [Lachancea mirantina]
MKDEALKGPLEASNVLKRKQEDCHEESLEAEIKRVALEDVEAEERVEDENEKTGDDDYIHLRMLCLVKEASMIVGPGGEKITRMKAESNTRINVSDNIRGISERVIYVRGRCEDVAKVFGMIVRAINEEEEGSKSDEKSVAMTVNILIPHHMMGCVIGRQGSRLREIENLSAAKLVAGPETLPLSNDRILCINGVADAVHIAAYYVGQTIINHQSTFAYKKCIFYQPNALHSVLDNSYGAGIHHQQQHQYRPGEKHRKRPYRPSAQPNYPYAYTSVPTFQGYAAALNISNVRFADALATTTIPAAGTPQISMVQQEIYIDDAYVGNVIGKGGKHINSIKESTGCSIQIDDRVDGCVERKITIKGTPMASHTAVLLINNKIEADKQNEQVRRAGKLL